MKKTMAIAFAALIFSACTSQFSGDKAKGITLLDGTSFSVEESIEGKPAIINFWASWCAFCATELPAFQEVHEMYPDVIIIAVNLQENARTAKTYWENGGYTFPSVLDPSSQLKAKYNVITQPTTIFLDENGTVVERRDGPLSETEIKMFTEKIAPSVQGRQPEQRSDSSRAIPSDADLVEAEPRGRRETSMIESKTPGFLKRWSKNYDERVKHTVNLDDILSGGVPKDGIASLDTPTFTSLNDADTWLTQEDVGTIYVGTETIRFYPFRILNWHEIVNDEVDGERIFVTYCPLCDSAAVYKRDDSTFGVSGFLMNSNLIMYDRTSESLWNQITGEAIVGERTGETLELLPSNVIQWKTVKEHFPDAEVLSKKTGYSRDYDRSPYKDYMEGDAIMFPVAVTDDRLENKERILGINVDGETKAYPRALIEGKNITDALNGSEVVLTWDSGRTTFLVDGKRVVPVNSFWFSWVAQYPETLVYEE